MIYKHGELVLEVQKDIINKELIQQKIGAIYKGTQLVWMTIYKTLGNCFSTGKWLQAKKWTLDEKWKNN